MSRRNEREGGAHLPNPGVLACALQLHQALTHDTFRIFAHVAVLARPATRTPPATKKMESNKAFRFFDMPRELRDKVYHLLTCDKTGRFCQTSEFGLLGLGRERTSAHKSSLSMRVRGRSPSQLHPSCSREEFLSSSGGPSYHQKAPLQVHELATSNPHRCAAGRCKRRRVLSHSRSVALSPAQ